MPSYCHTTLTVSGQPEMVHHFVANAVGQPPGWEEKTIFDFNQFVPYPKKFADLDIAAWKRRKEIEAMPAEAQKNIPWPKDGFNQGGYEWCCENWGTKWNAGEVSRAIGKAEGYKFKLEATYYFKTAWATPRPVIVAASTKYPKLAFLVQWRRDENEGEYKVKAGRVYGIRSRDLF